jgi:hypothetical protein
VGDVLVKLNGEPIPYNDEFRDFFTRQQQSLQVGKPFSYTVLRKNEAGAQQEVELKANAIVVEREVRHLLGWNEQATPEQLALRKSWISQ